VVSRVWDWLRQSRRNLASALANYREDLYEEVCFKAHQAGEKAVRGCFGFRNRLFCLIWCNALSASQLWVYRP